MLESSYGNGDKVSVRLALLYLLCTLTPQTDRLTRRLSFGVWPTVTRSDLDPLYDDVTDDRENT